MSQIRARVRGLVEGGIERASRGLVEELAEAARAAHQARLVRLERELTATGALVARYVDRDPLFRLGGWISACNRLWWLAATAERAIADPTIDGSERDAVLGVVRRSYTPVDGTVTVASLGATGWVSDTGYAGITVHLWDPASARVIQATCARPTALVGTDPRRLLFQPVSEVSLLTVFELAHGAWTLDDVRLSSDLRLSLHGGLVAVPAPPMGARAYAGCVVDGATALIDRLADAELDPIGGSAVHAWIELSAVRRVQHDETRAVVTAELVDRRGDVMRVVVPVRADRDVLVDNLARLALRPPIGVFGRAYLGDGELRFEPYTAVLADPVQLGFRRAGRVHEVHLALEPMPGDAEVQRRPVGADRHGADRPEDPVIAAARGALAEASDALEAVFAGGIAWPAVDVADPLRAAADTLEAGDASNGVARLRRLADRIEAIRAGGGSDAVDAAHEDAQWLAAWLRMMRSGLSVQAARSRLRAEPVALPTRMPGEDVELVPLGAERSGRRLVIHTVSAADGAPVRVEDDLPAGGAGDPADDALLGWPSRLFQADVTLDGVLRRRIVLTDHPIGRAGGHRVARPAFHTAATHGAPVGELPIPRTPRAHALGAAFRAPGVAHRTPDGWRIAIGGAEDLVVDDPFVAFDLEKRSVDAEGPERVVPCEVLGVLRRGAVVLLQLDGRFPMFDPTSTLWPADRVRARADGALVQAWVEAALGAELPPITVPDPIGDAARALDPSEAADHVEAHAERVRREVRGGEVLPAGVDLVHLGRALRTLAGGDPNDAPVRAIGLPATRLWLAAASALAPWLADRRAPSDGRVIDALVLVAGARLGPVLFCGG